MPSPTGTGAPKLPPPYLHLLPPTLLATTSLTYAVVETIFFRSMLAAPPGSAGNGFYGPFWRALLPPGASLAVFCSAGGAAAGTWAMRSLGGATGGRKAWWLVGVGAVAAGAHLAFVPAIANIINPVMEERVDSREHIRRWLRVHYIRTLLTDAVAFGCFLGAWFVD